MKRKEYKLLVEEWNRYLNEESVDKNFDLIILNEGFKETAQLFTFGALSLLGANLFNIENANAESVTTQTEKGYEIKNDYKGLDLKVDNQGNVTDANGDPFDVCRLSKQKQKDMAEVAKAVATVYSIDKSSKSGYSMQELIEKTLESKYGAKDTDEFLQYNVIAVGRLDVEEEVNKAINQAKKSGKKKVDIDVIKSLTVNKTSFSGGDKIDKIITDSADSLSASIQKRTNSIKSQNLKSLIEKDGKSGTDFAVKKLLGMSKYLRSQGLNSNKIKAIFLVLAGYDLNSSEVITTFKYTNSSSSGATMNPEVSRLLATASSIIDFELNDGPTSKSEIDQDGASVLQKRLAGEIFKSQLGIKVYGVFLGMYGMGFDWNKKLWAAAKLLKIKTSTKNRDESGLASGNPQLHR